MKSPKLLLVLLLFPLAFLAQEVGRGSVSTQTANSEPGNKHALIIGISNYESTDLTLNYANADASLFRDYLQNIVGVDQSRLTYLADQDATSLRITNELRKLNKTTESGDVVYLYFAGHGDVVDDFGQKEGFLLTVDSNANQEYYGNTGVVPLRILNLVTNSLTEKGVEVVLILDACRSGFVFEEGAQKNLQTVNNSFERSIKFLSCEPDQLSYESEKLKHGYFTYYLVLGLMGAADNLVQNNRLEYFELQQFLKQQVEGETQKKQGPLVISRNSSDDFGEVNSEIKNQALESIKNNSGIETAIAARGTTKTDEIRNSIENAVIDAFNSALSSRNYYGSDESAYELFRKAEKNPELSADFIEQLRYALVGALSISAQGLISEYISGQEILPKGKVFSEHAHYMKLCEELIDKDHYMINSVQTSRMFLEAYATIRQRNFSNYPVAKQNLLKALKIEERAAYIHNALGIIYRFEEKIDSSIYHYKRAKELIPTWSYPVSNLGLAYYDKHQNAKARELYDEALSMRGAKSSILNNLGVISKEEGKYTEAENYYQQSLEAEPNGVVPLKNLGNLYKERGNLKKAQEYLQEVTELDSTYVYGLYDLAIFLSDNNIDTNRAEALLKQAIRLEPFFAQGYARLGDFYRRKSTDQESKNKADSLYRRAVELDPFYEWAYAGRGWLLNSRGKKEEAVRSFEDGIAMNHNSSKMLYYFGNFLKNGIKDFEGAERIYKEAIEMDPDYINTYEGLIDLFIKTNRSDLAINQADALLKRNPQAPTLWNLLGDSHFAKEESEQAVVAYRKAIESDSTFAKAYANLAYNLIDLNKYDEAAENYKKAVEFNPISNSMVAFSGYLSSKARAMKREGDIDKEGELLLLAFKINPTERTRFDIASYYYTNDQPRRAYIITSDKDGMVLSKSWQLKYLELSTKIFIDLEDYEMARVTFEELSKMKNTDRSVLKALLKPKDSGVFGDGLKTIVSPLYLKDTYLEKNFSKKTIKKIKEL